MGKLSKIRIGPKTLPAILVLVMILPALHQSGLAQCINFLPWPQQEELHIPENLGELIPQSPPNEFVSVSLKDYILPDGQIAETGQYFPNDFAPLPYSVNQATLLYDFSEVPGFVNEVRVRILGTGPGTLGSFLNINFNDRPTHFIEFVEEYQETFDGGYTLTISPETPNQFIHELILTGPDIQSFRFGGRGMQFGELCYETAETCEISSIITTVLPCDANGNFNIELDLEYESPNDIFYVVIGNEEYTFSYDQLPVTIGPFASIPGTAYEIIVIDQFEDCLATTHVESVCPPDPECNFTNLFAEAHPCSFNGEFLVDIEFDNELPGSEGFLVIRNGDTFGPFDYSSPFVTIGPFVGDGSDLDFILIDIENPFCNGWLEMDPVTCTEPCGISNMEILSVSCGFAGGLAAFELNFNHEGAGENFTVYVDGQELGSYAYNELPVYVETINFNVGPVYSVKVVDNEHPDCLEINTFESPCGPSCIIEVVEATPTPCENGSFFVEIEYFVISNNFEDVFVLAQGQEFGPFSPGQQPILVGPFSSTLNGVLEMWMYSSSDPDCVADIAIETPNCGACEAWDMIVEAHPCDGNFFLVDLDFNHLNFGAQGFEIVGNGQNYGQFTIDDLPIIGLGPIEDDRNVYEFIAVDLEHPDCRVEGILESPNCDGGTCHIGPIDLIEVECLDVGTSNSLSRQQFGLSLRQTIIASTSFPE